MELTNESFIFEPSEPGEVTGEKASYVGTFEVRKSLNPLQKAQADQLRRNFLGNPTSGEAVDPEVQELAFAVSQLQVRVVKSPRWFQDIKTLPDTNVLIELTNKVLEVELNFKRGMKEKADKAKQELTAK